MTKETLQMRDHLLTETEENNCPVYKIRSYIYKKTGIWDGWDIFPRQWMYYYYDYIKPIYSPCHSKLRKSISRKWKDLSHVILDVNFQIIKSFYEDEYSKGYVDWENSSEGHKEFERWLKEAYHYITVERNQLEDQMNNSYPPTPPFDEMFVEDKDSQGKKVYRYVPYEKGTYEELYGEVNRLEKLISDRDTEIVIALVKYRDYLWT